MKYATLRVLNSAMLIVITDIILQHVYHPNMIHCIVDYSILCSVFCMYTLANGHPGITYYAQYIY